MCECIVTFVSEPWYVPLLFHPGHQGSSAQCKRCHFDWTAVQWVCHSEYTDMAHLGKISVSPQLSSQLDVHYTV